MSGRFTLRASTRLGRPAGAAGATFVALSLWTAFAFAFAAPPAQADPVIAAAGDIACRAGDSVTSTKCRQQFTADLLVSMAPDRILALGDLQYDDDLVNSGAGYANTWGRLSLKSITRPVIGNHESRSDYYDYFNGSGASNGPAGPRDNGWYSYDLGAWHLIAINSNCKPDPKNPPQVSCAAGSPQEQWLRSDLAANPDKCTLAYWHHPRFSNGHGGDSTFMGAIWQALYEAEADLVLSGHSHNYERFIALDPGRNPDPARGIRQFVVGNGGAFYTGGSASGDDKSAVYQNDVYGVLKLTLHPSSYDWQFVPEPGRTFTDSGSATCHRSGGGGGPPPAPTTGVGVFTEGSTKTLSYVAGAGQTNQVTVTLSGGNYTVSDPGFASIGDMDGAGGCSVSGSTATCPSSGVSLVRVDTKNGDDSVLVNAPTAASVMGGDGADSLVTGGGKDHLEGAAGNDTLDAGAGDDTLIGSTGDDTLNAGAGNDTLNGGANNDTLSAADGNDSLDAGAGDDALLGGLGIDTASYSSSTTAVQVDLTLTGPQATGGAGTDALTDLENVAGTTGNDRLVGNAAVNVLTGSDGGDLIYSRDGVKDTVDCGSGTDVASTDTLDSTSSCNTVYNVPPNTTITSAPTAKTDATTATFRFSSSQSPATFECSLDAAAWTTCTSPVTYSLLAPGPHTFDVRALDQFGSPDPTPARASWTVTAPPLASFGYSPAAPFVNEAVVFTSTSTALGAGNQIVVHEWDLDGNGTFETNSGVSPTTSRAYPSPATVSVGLRVTDANGKVATAPARSLTIHTRPPAPPPPSPGAPGAPGTPGAPGAPPGPSGPPAGSDRASPELTLVGRGSQRLVRGALALTAQCNEQCTVTASAKVKIGRASSAFSSRSVKRALSAGAKTKLRLKFSSKSRRGILRALTQKRRVVAKVTFQASDLAGNVSSGRHTIRLKR